jgi:hypoxanthine phosphoribosyltransferase
MFEVKLSPPNERHFKCEILSWRRVASDTKRLSVLIKNSGYIPHIVVAIGRGGLIPARIVCDHLHIKDLTTIKVEHWGIAATPDRKAVIKFPLNADIKDKRVLLVDDITDTGDTLGISLEYLKGFGPQEIRTAVIMHKTTSDFVPDYYAKRIAKWRWVIFPWHVWEDLTAFIREMKARGIHSGEDVHHELKSRYNINVSFETIKEILSEAN